MGTIVEVHYKKIVCFLPTCIWPSKAPWGSAIEKPVKPFAIHIVCNGQSYELHFSSQFSAVSSQLLARMFSGCSLPLGSTTYHHKHLVVITMTYRSDCCYQLLRAFKL